MIPGVKLKKGCQIPGVFYAGFPVGHCVVYNSNAMMGQFDYLLVSILAQWSKHLGFLTLELLYVSTDKTKFCKSPYQILKPKLEVDSFNSHLITYTLALVEDDSLGQTFQNIKTFMQSPEFKTQPLNIKRIRLSVTQSVYLNLYIECIITKQNIFFLKTDKI